jgi:hypothetical protein
MPKDDILHIHRPENLNSYKKANYLYELHKEISTCQ